jgi:hypothetical protein
MEPIVRPALLKRKIVVISQTTATFFVSDSAYNTLLILRVFMRLESLYFSMAAGYVGKSSYSAVRVDNLTALHGNASSLRDMNTLAALSARFVAAPEAMDRVIRAIPRATWQSPGRSSPADNALSLVDTVERVASSKIARYGELSRVARSPAHRSGRNVGCSGGRVVEETPIRTHHSTNQCAGRNAKPEHRGTSESAASAPDLQEIFVETLSQYHHESAVDAQHVVDRANALLPRLCSPLLSDEGRRAEWQAIAPKERKVLTGLMQLTLDIGSMETPTNSSARGLAQELVDASRPLLITTPQICELAKIGELQVKIEHGAAGRKIETPIEFLEAVLTSAGFSTHELLDADHGLAIDIDKTMLDMARSIYSRRRNERYVPADGCSLTCLQQKFHEALRLDLEELREASFLIPASKPRRFQPAIWFNGLAICGARNENVRSIAERFSPHTEAPIRRLELLKRRFQALGESLDYRIGTPHQSLATIVTRLGPTVGVDINGLEDPICLLSRFRELARLCGSAKCPLHPLHTAARHLARASGALVSHHLSKPQLITREVRTILGSLLAPDSGFSWASLPRMAADNQPHAGDSLADSAVRFYRRLFENTEVIAASDVHSLNVLLTQYLQERVASYIAMPMFDARAAAAHLMMETFDMQLCDVYRRHRYDYVAAVADTTFLGRDVVSTAQWGDWLDEFFVRRNASDSAQSIISHKGILLDTVGGLRAKHEKYSEHLRNDPIVIAKAKETLRLQGKKLTSEAIAWMARLIAARDVEAAHQWKDPSVEWSLDQLLVESIVPELERLLALVAPIRSIVDTVATGDPIKIVELVPFVGSSYEIAEGAWDGDLSEIGSGVVHLAEDAVLTWMAALPERQAVRAMEAALKRKVMAPLESPITSMMRDFDHEMRQLGDGVSVADLPARALDEQGRPMTLDADAGVGEAISFEMNIEERGDVGDVDAPNEPILKRAYAEPSTSNSVVRRTVEDVRRIFENIEAMGKTRRGARRFLPCVAGSRLVAQCGLENLFKGVDAASNAAIHIVNAMAKKSPTMRLLIDYAWDRGMELWSVCTTNTRSPGASFPDRIIYLAPLEDLEKTSYVTLDGYAPFELVRSFIHEFVHALTGFGDNVGGDPLGNRGPVVPITEIIAYELGEKLKMRIMYRRYITPEENAPAHLELRAALDDARRHALHENVKINALISGASKTRLESLEVLGAKLRSRVTVKWAYEIVEWINVAEFTRLAWGRSKAADVRARIRTHDGVIVTGDIASAPFLQALEVLSSDSVFRSVVNLWMTATPGKPWNLHFGVRAYPKFSPKPWHIDPLTRTMYFHSGPFYYASRVGPVLVSPERIVVGLFNELAFSDILSERLFDVSANRGLVWLDDQILKTSGTPDQRINAIWSTDATTLWKDTSLLTMAASDEDAMIALSNKQFPAVYDSVGD